MKQVTIYDIAQEAKVSVATVSRVINKKTPVKEATRKKILDIIDKFQFQPNALARSLFNKVTGTIGIILPDITNPFFPDVFSGIERSAREQGYTFLLCDTLGVYDRESQYLNILREKQVDGIIFMGGRINLLHCERAMAEEVEEAASRIPLVLVNGNLPGNNLQRVAVDEFKGAELATQYLIDRGHMHIAFIGGYDYMATTAYKVNGFRKVMKLNGLIVRDEWVMHAGYSIEHGNQQMQKLLMLDEKPTAVFCANDFTALGAIKAAVKAKIRIPEDMSIMGFDDIQLATSFYPELTTVSQRMELLGSTAIQVLHKLINKEKVKRVTVVEPELIIRESTN